MSNSAVVRSLRRRFNFYYNSPIFNKYGRSLRDFLAVMGMIIIFTLFVLIAFVIGFIDDAPYDYRSSCGTPECIDQ